MDCSRPPLSKPPKGILNYCVSRIMLILIPENAICYLYLYNILLSGTLIKIDCFFVCTKCLETLQFVYCLFGIASPEEGCQVLPILSIAHYHTIFV